MAKRFLLALAAISVFLFASIPGSSAQEGETSIRVEVDMVQLNVAVMDSKGNYVTGLKPSDFDVTEDGIVQKVATFGEGNEATRKVTSSGDEEKPGEGRGRGSNGAADSPETSSELGSELGSAMAGANVFILFDTSNYMYRGFVFAQDAIAEFVRSLDNPDRVAFYSYSRDLSRATTLTPTAIRCCAESVTTVAGDDAALYNALLMTLKDAGQNTGRKVVVVFSNGPDNYSMVPPEDVAELAQSKGIPIYMISTREAKLEPVSSTVFKRMSAATGGEAYFAKTWREQQKAFASIRNDLAHLYSVSYYPQPNPNRGWRTITVKLKGERMKRFHIRTRNGYRPENSHERVERAGAPSSAEPVSATSN